MPTTIPTIPWAEIETVLVDMDGTVLDLAFDNFFWQELVPARYAGRHALSEAEARLELASRYARERGSLNWYCVEHWSRELDLDIKGLKWEHRHLIGFLPGAPEFLARVRGDGKRLVLVTNAHRASLELKVAQTGLDSHVDQIVCAHDLARCKEQREFWPDLERRDGFDPERTVLIEDSLPVLEAARAHGVRVTVAVRRPDSRHPPREIRGFPSVESIGELAPG